MTWKIKPPVRGITSPAIYRNPIVDSYQGNPFIEALPPILSEEEAIALMRYRPHYQDSYSTLPSHLRLHHTMDILRYVQPLRRYRELERVLSRLIRAGYISRNPAEPGFYQNVNDCVDDFMQELKAKLQYELKTEPKATITGTAILGISGVGKTTAIERILLLYPQVIQHRKYKNQIITVDQVVWLKLDCPHNGSTKALCIKFFEEIDAVLGTSYLRSYVKPSDTEETLVESMARLALLHGLGVLVIDELQHLSVANSGGAERMMNFFVGLSNKIGLPLVLIGTPQSSKVLTKEFQETRRTSGHGSNNWDRMVQDDEWQYFLEGLWPYQYTKHKVPLTQKFSDVMYDQTQGIADLVIKLFILSQIRAIESNQEKITPAIIRSAAKDGFELARPVLNVLRNNNSNYEDFPDIFIDIKPYYQSAVNKAEERLTDDENPKNCCDAVYLEIASWLMDGGISYDSAFLAAKEAVKHLGSDSPILMLRKLAISYLPDTSLESSHQSAKESSKKTGSKKNSSNTKKLESKLLAIDNSSSANDVFNQLHSNELIISEGI